MPSYNHEKFIADAIGSVLNQTIEDFELIIVDDHSTDNSLEIINDYKDKNKKIRVIVNKENKGIAKSVNDLKNLIRGKYVAYIASDDIWAENKLEKQLKVLEKNEDLFVCSDGKIIDFKGRITEESYIQKFYGKKRYSKRGNPTDELLTRNYIFGSSIILKRENIMDISLDESLKYYYDYKFFVDLALKYNVYLIQEPLGKYRIHGSNLTQFSSPTEEWIAEHILVRKYIIKSHGDTISSKIKSINFAIIGYLYLECGRNKKAKKWFCQAIRLEPFSITNIYCLILSFSLFSFILKLPFLRKFNRFLHIIKM
ncbi:MAG: glycosyltransferase [Candidatus Hermodarchaeota archaeon]